MVGKALTFTLAGLKGSNFMMRDRQTGSRWQQATGEAFEGPLKGSRLALYPFLLTTWEEWRSRHPDTLALVAEPDRIGVYQRVATRTARSRIGGRGRTPRGGVLREDPRLPNYEQVMGLEVGGAHKAYPLARLKEQPVINDQVGSEPVLLVYDAHSDTTTAFSRRLRERLLTFRSLESAPVRVSDLETSSVWNMYGECIRGPLQGQKLGLLVPLPSFWFSWAEFFPGTEIYTGASD